MYYRYFPKEKGPPQLNTLKLFLFSFTQTYEEYSVNDISKTKKKRKKKKYKTDLELFPFSNISHVTWQVVTRILEGH